MNLAIWVIWRSSTCRWNLQLPDLQTNCSDLSQRQGTRIVVLIMAPRVTCPIMTSLRLEQVYHLHCDTLHKLCRYGCSSAIDTVILAAMDAQCHWHCQPCSYGCSSAMDVNPVAMDAPVSLMLSALQLWMPQWQWQCQLSILQLWMLQCHWRYQPCSYGSSSVSDSVNPAAMDAPVSVTVSILQLWMLQCHWHWSIHSCRIDIMQIITSVLQLMDAPLSTL